MQQKSKKNLILFLSISTFIVISAIISKSILGSYQIQETEVEKEAKKASVSDRLRSKNLEKVELGKARISDTAIDTIDNKSVKNSTVVLNKDLKTEVQSQIKSDDNKNKNSNSIWNAVLTAKEDQVITIDYDDDDDISDDSKDLNKNKHKKEQERDANKFVELVSNNEEIIRKAVIHKTNDNDNIAQYETQALEKRKNNSNSKFSRLAAMSAQKLQTISGVEQIAGRTQMFKAGTRVYAILPDKLTVSSGESISTSLIAFGSTEQKFPDHTTFVGKAQLNKSQRRVEILIDKCVNTRDDSPHLPCSAIVKDVLGDNGLSGRIYDPSNWQLIVSTAGTFLSTYVLGSLTTSTTQTGVTVDQSIANQVRQALAGSINAVAGRINDNLNRSGTEITISPGSIVQVFFVDTTNSWNLK